MRFRTGGLYLWSPMAKTGERNGIGRNNPLCLAPTEQMLSEH